MRCGDKAWPHRVEVCALQPGQLIDLLLAAFGDGRKEEVRPGEGNRLWELAEPVVGPSPSSFLASRLPGVRLLRSIAGSPL